MIEQYCHSQTVRTTRSIGETDFVVVYGQTTVHFVDGFVLAAHDLVSVCLQVINSHVLLCRVDAA
jgi:hypothetical protein